MQVTKLIVSYSETANLGDYSNVKPVVTVEANIDEVEDEMRALDDLTRIAIDRVQAIVDDALEANGQPARYSKEDRYTIYTRYERRKDGLPQIAIIAPAGRKDFPATLHASTRGFRLDAIRTLAAKDRDSLLIDTTLTPDKLEDVLHAIVDEENKIIAEREEQQRQRLADLTVREDAES